MRRTLANALITCLFAATLAAQQGRRAASPDAVWQLLAQRHDKDSDGRITQAEYGRGADKFAALDRDGDGALTAADFATTPARGGRRADGSGRGAEMSPEQRALRALDADADRDGQLTRDEVSTRFRAADADGDGKMVPNAQGRALLSQADGNKDDTLTLAELLALFDRADADQDGRVALGGPAPAAEPPKAGEAAPDFDLPTLEDPAQKIKLSSFAGRKPVALIFGSYT